VKPVADAQDVFEVASIKPAVPQGSDGRHYSGCQGVDPGMVACTNMGLGGLIAMAYDISLVRISGLKPSHSTYDILAKVPAGARHDQIRLMWQNLLAERFKLAVHRDKQRMQVCLLDLAKGGPKLKESVDKPGDDVAEDSTQKTARTDKDGFSILPPGASATIFRYGTAHFAASKLSMEQFIDFLQRRLAADLKIDRPIVDATGLTGKYDFKLMWLPGGDPSADGPMLSNALETQLGLKLEQKQAEVKMLVVDHADNSPIEN
jgi:uncharacterized protein (TIGR03435 family)